MPRARLAIIAITCLAGIGYVESTDFETRQIDDDSLEMIRGLDNSSTVKDNYYSCEDVEVDTLNQFNPPGYGQWVSYDNCMNNSGQTCIECGQSHTSKSLKDDTVSNGYRYDTTAYDCTGGTTGRKGVCINNVCANWVSYSCGTYLLNVYQQTQPGGGP